MMTHISTYIFSLVEIIDVIVDITYNIIICTIICIANIIIQIFLYWLPIHINSSWSHLIWVIHDISICNILSMYTNTSFYHGELLSI